MKTIQEYWARLVAAGLAPDKENEQCIYYRVTNTNPSVFSNILGKVEYEIMSNIYPDDNFIQLRKDGIDLVKLEWRPYTSDDDMNQEYWVLQSDMVGVDTVNYVHNNKRNRYRGQQDLLLPVWRRRV